MNRRYSVLYDSELDRYSIIFQDQNDNEWYVYLKGVSAEQARTIVDSLNNG